MFHNRYNYWSCSIVADMIRNTKKPSSGTAEEWKEWRNNTKNAHPFRYWLADKALDSIQNFIYWPYDVYRDINSFCSNYFISHPNQLRAHKHHIKPWQWTDVSDRFLPCMFDTFIDFVEIEKAYMGSWNDDSKKYKWKNGRCPQAGIAALEWETTLIYDESSGVYPEDKEYGKKTHQAIAATEILELYKWWTEIYSNRVDPSDASGWSEYCNKKHTNNEDALDMFIEDKSKESKKVSKSILSKLQKLEKQQKDEDTNMMIKLLKVRDSLWT